MPEPMRPSFENQDSEREPIYCDTLIAPEGWGTGEIPADVFATLGLLMGGQLSEAYTRASIDKELRAVLEGSGVSIIERSCTAEGLDENEATIAQDVDEERLMAELPRIAPEACVIPSEEYASFVLRPTAPVFAYCEGQAGGIGKYALDNLEQLYRMQRLFATVPGTVHLSKRIKFKPIIETPSSRYTSYRMVTTATGDVIAGGLLYSGKPQEDGQVASTATDPDYRSRLIWDYFEQPESPYYLNARKITSNISGGGGCIPLNPTERSRFINPTEQMILAAHDIEDQEIPPRILGAAQKIGRHLGPHSGLVFGLDFLQGTEGTIWFLEANSGPGVQTVNEVENGGSKNFEQGYRLLMRKTFASVFNIPVLGNP